MSLKHNNRNSSLVSSGDQEPDVKGSLRRATNAGVAKPTGRGLAAVKKASARTNIASGNGKIGFVFDATASRNHVWETAQVAFKQMFKNLHGSGAIQLRFMDFGNPNDVNDRDWTDNLDKITDQINQVHCRGGITQINDCLRRFARSKDQERPNSIIYVGDHYEENEDDLEDTIRIMNENNISVFTFLDSDDSYAEKIYRRLAEATGGTYAKFGADMPLRDLCEGVALKTTGGDAALSRLQNPAARQLLLGGPSQ